MNELHENRIRSEVTDLIKTYSIPPNLLPFNVNDDLEELYFHGDQELWIISEMIYSIVVREINENRRKD